MNRKMGIGLGLVLVSIVVLSIVLLSGFHGDASDEVDKPILMMTPSELFQNLKLRQLAIAAQHGDVKKIDALIKQGADVNGKGKHGITPLFSAWEARNKVGYKALLDHGANPNVIWSDGYTLLNLIAGTDNPYYLKLALAHGANPNLVEPWSGDTPLFSAVTPDGKVNLPLLIKAGANLDFQERITKETAAFKGADLNQFDAVYVLLQAGASCKLKAARGYTLREATNHSLRVTNHNSKLYRWAERVLQFLNKHGC